MEVSPTPQPLTLCKVLSEVKRINKSQRRTFYSLAFLFLFPTSLAAVVYPLLSKSLSPSSHAAASTSFLFLIVAAIVLISTLILSPCAIGSITYAAIHGFHGEPVSLKAAVNSLSASFFPLLATILSAQLITSAAALALALLIITTTTTTIAASLGLASAWPYLVGFETALFVVMMLYLQVNWSLAYPVVLAESIRGFAALRRSKKLIKGKRGLALSLSLIYGTLFCVVFLCDNSFTAENAAKSGGASRPSTAAEWCDLYLYLVFKLLVSSFLITMTQLSYLIANTVLYVYCRADSILPVDEEKVPLLV